jgi:hypothetical protein
MEETQLLPKKRSTFITVLCILTFIGSGWGIIDGIIDYVAADTVGQATQIMEDQMGEAMDQIEDSEDMPESTKNFMENMVGGVMESITPDNIRKSALINILASLLCLFGAYLMWNLNKKGFYIYLAGTLLAVIGMALVFGGLLGMAAAGGTGFVGLVMCILYGVNLKDMN